MESRRMGRAGRLALFIVGLWGGATMAADWSVLNQYQRTISHGEFDALVTNVYCPSGALANYLTYSSNSVTVYSTTDKSNAPLFTLQFSDKPGPNLPSLKFKRIALDPGHIEIGRA